MSIKFMIIDRTTGKNYIRDYDDDDTDLLVEINEEFPNFTFIKFELIKFESENIAGVHISSK